MVVELYTAEQIAEMNGVCGATVHLHAKRGGIPKPAHHVGGRSFYTEEQRDQIREYFLARFRWQKIGDENAGRLEGRND